MELKQGRCKSVGVRSRASKIDYENGKLHGPFSYSSTHWLDIIGFEVLQRIRSF